MGFLINDDLAILLSLLMVSCKPEYSIIKQGSFLVQQKISMARTIAKERKERRRMDRKRAQESDGQEGAQRF